MRITCKCLNPCIKLKKNRKWGYLVNKARAKYCDNLCRPRKLELVHTVCIFWNLCRRSNCWGICYVLLLGYVMWYVCVRLLLLLRVNVLLNEYFMIMLTAKANAFYSKLYNLYFLESLIQFLFNYITCLVLFSHTQPTINDLSFGTSWLKFS